MKIKPEIEVYPDPEYCNKDQIIKCQRIRSGLEGQPVCILFLKNGIDYEPLKETDGKILKCSQCRKDWTEAKLKEPIDHIMIDGHLFECLERPIYGSCGKIKASLVCDDYDRLKFVEKFRTQKDVPVSTHGIFNHVGKVFASGMFPAGDRMHIEITILISAWMVEN